MSHSVIKCQGNLVDYRTDCAYLVSQHVLLIAGRVPGHLQTENTQQEARVPVEAGKVLQDVRVEGRTKRTHLQTTPESALGLRTDSERGRMSDSDSPGRCRASLLVCGLSSCGSGMPARSQTPTHIYDTWLRERGTVRPKS